MTAAWRLLDAGQSVAPPSHWRRIRLGNACTLVNGVPFDSERFGPDGDYPLVRIRDLNSDKFETWVTGDVPASCVLRDGDVVIGMDGDFNVAWWTRGRAAMNQRVCLLRATGQEIDQRFLYYALPRTLRTINDLTFFTTVKHLSGGDILRERLTVPPLDEQRRIVAFLDDETARIDELIAEHQRILRLARQRLVTAADTAVVGRGLDPRTPSRCPWWDSLPIGWETRELRHCASGVTVGVVVNPSTYVDEEGDVPFIRGTDVRPFMIRYERAQRMTAASNKLLAKSVLCAGDIVVVRVGAPGTAAVVPPELDGANCASLLIVRQAPDVHTEYLCNVLNSSVGRDQVRCMSNGAAQEQVNAGDIVGLLVPLPPKVEQLSIARALAEERLRFRRLEHEIEKHVSVLRERREALVTAAVTGGLEAVAKVA